MHRILTSPRSEALREYVRLYAQREALLPSSQVLYPVPARAAHVLEFTFGDPHQVCIPETGAVKRAPRIVVVGLQTYRRVQLIVWGRVDTFAIFFEATGLNRLFGAPVLQLTNRDEDAQAVLGPAIENLGQQLGDCRYFPERVRIADEFLLRFRSTSGDFDRISKAASELRSSLGCGRIENLAEQTGLGIRQFQRKFCAAVGVPPKLFARIVRFEAALEIRAISPHRSWTEVAHQLGYHDQMHLVHDFQELAGATPTSVLAQLEEVIKSEHKSAPHGVRD